jgi:hypothetical protein
LNYTLCENSGRYEIAEMIARVFPTYKARATSVWDGMFERPLPSGPYPKDSLRYRSKSMVEFTTPAQTEGLGNFDSWLKKADLPIVGAAMLVFDSVCELPQMVRVSVRVPPELVPLRETMVRFVELRAAEAIVK